jgi:ribosomal protein S18 acetylase RimI-like enzyme
MVANGNVVLQPASPEFADVVPDLICETNPKIFSYILDDRTEVLRRWISALWSSPGNDFSHEFARVAVRDGELLGLELGFAGADMKRRGRESAELSQGLFDEENLAHMREAMVRGIGYVTPYVPDRAYYLRFLSVVEAGRNQGIGGQLLQNAIERARGAGLRSVHLDVYAGNPAIRLYERAGMEILVETRVPSLERDHGIPPHYRMVLGL